MVSERIDRLRQAVAEYWKPAISTVSVIVATLTAGKDFLKKVGFDLKNIPIVGSTGVTRWVVLAGIVLILILVRFQRLGLWVTRLLLGTPKLPAVAGRIFRGPQPYGPDDKLPGREGEVDDCWTRLDEKAFLVLDGESGCGKSSFLHAALLPKARGRYRRRCHARLPSVVVAGPHRRRRVRSRGAQPHQRPRLDGRRIDGSRLARGSRPPPSPGGHHRPLRGHQRRTRAHPGLGLRAHAHRPVLSRRHRLRERRRRVRRRRRGDRRARVRAGHPGLAARLRQRAARAGVGGLVGRGAAMLEPGAS